MASYQTFTVARATEPDMDALLVTLRGSDPSVGVQHVVGTATFTLKKATAWTAGQVNAAQSVLENAPAITPQRQAQNEIEKWPLAMRAFALALIDELNVLRAKAGLEAVTPAQAMQAIKDKAGTL